MRQRALVLTALAALLVPSLAHAAPAQAPRQRAAKPRLVAFDSCGGLVRYARRHARDALSSQGLPARRAPGPVALQEDGAQKGGASPATGVDFSATNVQEAGVDEPDVVKTDGSRIFAVAQGRLHAVDGAAARRLGSLKLEGSGHELLLHGDRLLVVSSVVPEPSPVSPDRRPSAPEAPDAPVATIAPYEAGAALLAEVDVSDPAAMRVVRTMRVDGAYLSARLSAGTARVVISSTAPALTDTAAVRRSRLATWMPSALLHDRRSGRRTRRALVGCRSVRRPTTFAGLGMFTVLTVDLDKGLPAIDADSLMTDARTVYASQAGLFVATERWVDPATSVDDVPAGQSTAVHRFDVSNPQRTDYRASGAVRGFLLNQWSLSEHGGVLRVATTEQPPWLTDGTQAESESFVTVLEPREGALAEIGRVGGLGRGERIFAVRFIGDVGYVVTFRQTDPLYTIDLATPTRPRVLGELKIPGYSAYLHPVGPDLLLGVGQDAGPDGRVRGTQLSLFDVSDLRRPVRLHKRTLAEGSSSEVEFEHRAFLFWPATGLAVLPVQAADADQQGSAALGFRVDRVGGIAEAGRVTHGQGEMARPIRRSLVVGDRLYTMSELGLRASALDTLADVAWVPFG